MSDKKTEDKVNILLLFRLIVILIISIFVMLAIKCNFNSSVGLFESSNIVVIIKEKNFFKFLLTWIVGGGSILYTLIKLLSNLNLKLFNYQTDEENEKSKKNWKKIYTINNILILIFIVMLDLYLRNQFLSAFYFLKPKNVYFFISVCALIVDILIVVFRKSEFIKLNSNLLVGIFSYAILLTMCLSLYPFLSHKTNAWGPYNNALEDRKNFFMEEHVIKGLEDELYDYPQNIISRFFVLNIRFNNLLLIAVGLKIIYESYKKNGLLLILLVPVIIYLNVIYSKILYMTLGIFTPIVSLIVLIIASIIMCVKKRSNLNEFIVSAVIGIILSFSIMSLEDESMFIEERAEHNTYQDYNKREVVMEEIRPKNNYKY